MTCLLQWYVEMETRCRIPISQTFGRIQWHVIPEPHITLQGAATWWIHCKRFQSHMPHCRVQLPDEINVMIMPHCYSIRHIENRFSPYFIIFVFNAGYALTSGGFRIVSDTLVSDQLLSQFKVSLQRQTNTKCDWRVLYLHDKNCADNVDYIRNHTSHKACGRPSRPHRRQRRT